MSSQSEPSSGDSTTLIEIEVVYALPEAQQLATLELPEGCCARAAFQQAIDEGLIVIDNYPSQQAPIPIGVYGQLVDDDYLLKAGDRLEIYRPLLQDPKERRRQQARQPPPTKGS